MVIITDYSPKYHSEVNRIFSEGIMSNVPSALSMSLTFYKFWIFMVFTFLLSWIIHSWTFALLLVSCCIGMYTFTVYYCYRQYVRYVHLLIGRTIWMILMQKKITFMNHIIVKWINKKSKNNNIFLIHLFLNSIIFVNSLLNDSALGLPK